MITLSSALWERTLGMCGSLSANPYDDFRSMTGERLDSLAEFVESWALTDQQCELSSPRAPLSHPCQPGSQADTRATQFCQKMLEREGLESCYSTINPMPYYESCRWTFCQESHNINFARDLACESVESYVRACRDEGVQPLPWRTQDFCREY